jgi:hypothetical protein
MARARRMVDEEAWKADWAAGAEMGADQSVDIALEELSTIAVSR